MKIETHEVFYTEGNHFQISNLLLSHHTVNGVIPCEPKYTVWLILFAAISRLTIVSREAKKKKKQ